MSFLLSFSPLFLELEEVSLQAELELKSQAEPLLPETRISSEPPYMFSLGILVCVPVLCVGALVS